MTTWPAPGTRRTVGDVGHFVETTVVHTDTGDVLGLYSSLSGTVRTADGRRFTGWTEHPDGSITPTERPT